MQLDNMVQHWGQEINPEADEIQGEKISKLLITVANIMSSIDNCDIKLVTLLPTRIQELNDDTFISHTGIKLHSPSSINT